MKIGRDLFVSSAVFGIVIAVIYWFSSRNSGGTILLGVMAAALAFAAGYMTIAERNARLIGDRGNATNADAAGERIGIFTSASPWPITVAFGAYLTLMGLVLLPALSAFGLALLLFGLLRLGRESR